MASYIEKIEGTGRCHYGRTDRQTGWDT